MTKLSETGGKGNRRKEKNFKKDFKNPLTKGSGSDIMYRLSERMAGKAKAKPKAH